MIWLIMLSLLAAVLSSIPPLALFLGLGSRLNLFATVFLGIFIEALPYLLLGTLISGLVEVFLDHAQIGAFHLEAACSAALTGAFMGLIFPVCECGVIPLTRRLFHKGLPLPAGIAFLLAAPVLNPIVIFSTAAAFGWVRMLAWRVGLSLLFAVIVGLVFSVEQEPLNVLRGDDLSFRTRSFSSRGEDLSSDKIQQALLICGDEFFEMGRYLVMGAVLAAILQTFTRKRPACDWKWSHPFGARHACPCVILSICSTVDAFVALSFVGTFSFGSILSFLVFGPMVDIKAC